MDEEFDALKYRTMLASRFPEIVEALDIISNEELALLVPLAYSELVAGIEDDLADAAKD